MDEVVRGERNGAVPRPMVFLDRHGHRKNQYSTSVEHQPKLRQQQLVGHCLQLDPIHKRC